MSALGSTVEDDGHVSQDMIVVQALKLRERTAVKLSSTKDEDREVCYTIGDSSISDTTEGHVVKDDEVKLFAELICKLVKTFAQKELRRIGRYCSRSDDRELRSVGVLTDDLIDLYRRIGEILGDPLTDDTGSMGECPLTQV